ncbi:MAG: M28 family metallopeptidase [Candidatus Acidiferrales bacterium]
MGRSRILAGILMFSVLWLPLNAQEMPLAGYSNESSRAERQWEEKFRAIPSPDRMRDAMQLLSAHPHNVGTAYDKQNAEWIAARLTEYGFPTQIETFEVLYPTPKERAVELVAPTTFQAKLQEPAVKEDPTSSQQSEQLPTYNAYSIDGDVTAPLVYVNHGVPEDYEELARHGVSVQGAIVIARYGGSWRGIKPKVAAEHGAVGCLIYSDPHEDGYFAGATFPAGAWRPKEGVQRGSVADMPLYAGDPLTPGVGAKPGVKRLALADAPTITKIPVLPISYGDAEPLLAAIGGAVAPQAWRGALGFTYHLGPGPAKVHLKVKSNWDMKTIYDVIGKISGAQYPDEWIIRGNHHDAWVNGAQDPLSGQVSLLEEARALGELLKTGWRPKRTIVYAAWDGEEPGLLGSTEWVEEHAQELDQKAEVYINSDVVARGFLSMGGSHTLEKFINEVTRGIADPEKPISIWKRSQLQSIAEPSSPRDRAEARERPDLRIDALGSGSDYTPFLQHAGIASLDLGFRGEENGGVYHSVYDDFYWFTHFSDTNFLYCHAMAQTAGTAVMRLADADLLPFEFGDFAETIQKYVHELETLADSERAEIIERNREIEEDAFNATSDPREKYVAPTAEAVPPYLNFTPLENSAVLLTQSADRYAKAWDKSGAARGELPSPEVSAEVNRLLRQSERKLLSASGLPGRPWYKHEIYAPGFYTGYAVKTLPAVREAIEQKKWAEVDANVSTVAQILKDEAALIDAAAAKLVPSGH